MILNIFLFSDNFFQGPGSNTWTYYTGWILLMLAVSFLLGLLLGYLLWYRYRRRVTILERELADCRAELDACKKRLVDMEEELANARYAKEKVDGEYAALRSKHADLDIKLKACQEQLGGGMIVGRDGGSDEIDELKARIEYLERRLRRLRGKYVHLEHQYELCQENVDELKASSGIVEIGALGDGDEYGLDYDAAFTSDNLQIIEGIGPKAEGVLKAAGINNWHDLANTSSDRLREILSNAGSNYALLNPDSWPNQAEMADNREWLKLIEYQKFLDGGVAGTGSMDTDAKAEKMAAKILGVTVYKLDDLKAVEGIGPKIEELLHNAGINTWRELANTSVAKLQEILNSAGDRFQLADPATWPEQAELAADGKWKQLKELQDYLLGGVDPGA